jgi:hypothetical protein
MSLWSCIRNVNHHQLNLKAFFQNGEMTVVLLRGENARLSGLGVMFQKTCKKHQRALHFPF